MKIVVQRVTGATCHVDNEIYSQINGGLVVFVGIKQGDEKEEINYLVDKIMSLRIFSNQKGKMDYSISRIDGQIMIIPNFTLCADLYSGQRPGFENAASPERAEFLFDKFVEGLRSECDTVKSGKFGAMMDITVKNEGPVTLVIDTEEVNF